MAQAPRRFSIADVLGFGAIPQRNLTQGYRQAVSRPAPRQPQASPSFSQYKPGVIQGVTENLVGTPTEYLARLMGMPEQDAVQYAASVVDRIGDTTGFRGVEQSGRNIFSGNASPSDYLNVGLTAGLAAFPLGRPIARGLGAAEQRILGQRLENIVVPEPNFTAKSSILEGRALNRPGQVTHVQRNMSPAELEDAIKTGRFNVPEGGTKFSQGDKRKWWSAADEEGIFGRPWARTGSVTVRMPAGALPKGRAASIKNAEILDPTTNSWMPLREYFKKYEIPNPPIAGGGLLSIQSK